MAVLLDWITVTLVASAAQQVLPTIQMANPLIAPIADARLLDYFGCMVQCWLAGLVAALAAPTGMQAGPQVINLMQQDLDDQHAHQLTDEQCQAEARCKTPMQQWNFQVMGILQVIMGVMQDINLPPLWHIVASAPKHLVRGKAQSAFDTMAQQLGFSMYLPIITAALAWSLEILNLCVNSPMVLTEGFQPFNLVPLASACKLSRQ